MQHANFVHLPVPAMQVIVSCDSPHLILSSDSEVLGFTEQHMRGRSLKLFYGPTTDSARLSAAIKNSALQGDSHTILAELYEGSGRCYSMIVTCSPCYDSTGGLLGCLLLFEPSDAISLTEALEASPCPKALVSGDALHHRVLFLNPEFEHAFGYSPIQFLGRPLDSIGTLPGQLTPLVRAALSGRAARGNVWIRTTNGAELLAGVTCVPVADALAAACWPFSLLPTNAPPPRRSLPSSRRPTSWPRRPATRPCRRCRQSRRCRTSPPPATPSPAAPHTPSRSASTPPTTASLCRRRRRRRRCRRRPRRRRRRRRLHRRCLGLQAGAPDMPPQPSAAAGSWT